MTKKKIWFGNAEKMMWVNCPSTNITRGRARWQESGTYLNGGAFEKSSAMSHRKYSIDWNLMESYEAAKIMSFYEGVYGQSPIQFVDPFAAKSNILPLHWSTPRLCAEGAAPSLTNTVPEKAGGTASTLEGSPTGGAFFPADASMSQTITIPVPPGKNLYVGAQGGTSTVLRTNEARNPEPKYTEGTQVYAQNLVPNPQFAVNAATWSPRGGIVASASWPQMWPGQRGDRIRAGLLTSDGTNAYLGIEQSVTAAPVAGGQWVAVSALIACDTPDNVGCRMDAVCNTTSGHTYHASPGSWQPAPFYEGRRITWAFQAPEDATTFGVRAQMFSGANGTMIPAGRRLWLSDVQAATAATEEEALAQVANYFDGSTTFDTGLTPAWSGAAHASSSTLTGTLPAAWFSPNSNTFQYVVPGASPMLRARTRGGSTDTYVDPQLRAQPVTGQWVAMGVDVWAYNNTTANNMSLQIALYNGAIGTGQSRKVSPIPRNAWTRVTHVRQITDAGTGGQVIRSLVWPLQSSDTFFAVRNYVVAYATTEAEALAAVATPFSGDTAPTADGRQYSWSTSTSNGNAASIESAGTIRSVPNGYGLKVRTEGAANVTSIPYTNSQATSAVFQNPGVCTLTYTGGMLTSAVATIGTKPPRQDIFRQGEGNTGLKFVGEPTRTGYSSVMDLESVSAEFVEVGAWE